MRGGVRKYSQKIIGIPDSSSALEDMGSTAILRGVVIAVQVRTSLVAAN